MLSQDRLIITFSVTVLLILQTCLSQQHNTFRRVAMWVGFLYFFKLWCLYWFKEHDFGAQTNHAVHG